MQGKIFTISFLILLNYIAAEDENCPTIISRSQWGGQEATNMNYLILPIPYIVIHHTVTPECTTKVSCSARVENIRSYHMNDLGWHDMGYSFLIGGDGNVYEGSGWNREGAHTYGYNKRSLGIAFIGNFQEKLASDNMMEAAHKLILCGKSKEIFREDVHVIAARQVGSTASPGLELYGQIQNWPEWFSNP
ncbi:peptidoglycan-recognition protein SA isoform X1 [Colletes gigas]|uniref:peptidoglycan-recognition protein SA isoform X1 n=1 Tax=Colletes gigas TaxID=935657 RepID=UPI001C9A609D|nr:peptidoglycan-recognition protein SA isoform X1 [Colletes gigas]